MAVNIQIRDVPEEVRDRIAAHAAEHGLSHAGVPVGCVEPGGGAAHAG